MATTITKCSIITPGGTAFVLLADAAADVLRTPDSYVYRAWEFDPRTREYVWDTGIDTEGRPFDARSLYSPVCVFPQPAPESELAR